MSEEREVIHTRIWEEEPEPDNPFAAAACRCRGYDVYGELLGRARWSEYLYLLFVGERPSSEQARLLEDLAVALANAGPRDAGVRAAMNGGAGGSTAAACLMAALAAGAGQYGGAHEVYRILENWAACGCDLDAWCECLRHPPEEERADIWSPMEHPPGFDPHGASCATPVRRTLAHLASHSPGPALAWLTAHREALEAAADCPLAMTGVAAAAFADLGLAPAAGEMLFLILRLPGAAVHALEQMDYGWRRYPFFHDAVILADDPGAPSEERP